MRKLILCFALLLLSNTIMSGNDKKDLEPTAVIAIERLNKSLEKYEIHYKLNNIPDYNVMRSIQKDK